MYNKRFDSSLIISNMLRVIVWVYKKMDVKKQSIFIEKKVTYDRKLFKRKLSSIQIDGSSQLHLPDFRTTHKYI